MDLNTLIIGAIIGAIVTLPIAIFGNFATDWIKSYFKNRSLSRRERSIKILIDDYKFVKGLKEDSSKLTNFMLHGLVLVLTVTFLDILIYLVMSVFLATNTFLYVTLFILSLTALVMLYIISSNYGHTNRFDEYKQKTIKKLIKLGGNPEDLDKEED